MTIECMERTDLTIGGGAENRLRDCPGFMRQDKSRDLPGDAFLRMNMRLRLIGCREIHRKKPISLTRIPVSERRSHKSGERKRFRQDAGPWDGTSVYCTTLVRNYIDIAGATGRLEVKTVE